MIDFTVDCDLIDTWLEVMFRVLPRQLDWISAVAPIERRAQYSLERQPDVRVTSIKRRIERQHHWRFGNGSVVLNCPPGIRDQAGARRQRV